LRQRLDADLKTYASFGSKTSGSLGDLAAANWIGGRLSSAGYAAEKIDFPVPAFTTKSAEVRIGGAIVPVAPQPVVVPTPAGGITAPGILVRSLYEARAAKGRVAVLVLPFARHAAIFSAGIKPLVDAIIRSGPKALVIVTTGPTGSIIALNTRLKPIAPFPIALMAPRDLPLVEQGLANGREITLVLTGVNEEKSSCNIVARRAAGSKWLAFSTPRSGWGPCVGERGPGIAMFLDLCEWAAVRFPQHSLFAINAGGHELDFSGMHHSLAEGPPAVDTIVWTHLGAGLATRDAVEVIRRNFALTSTADIQRVMMVSPLVLEDARIAFNGLPGYEDPIEVVSGAGELSSIIDRGYVRAFAGLGIHRWCHVEEDTIDKVDATLIVPVLESHRALVERLVART
jgi:hypothetical protein